MYRLRSTGELLSQRQVIALRPNTSFPDVWSLELIESLGLDLVAETQEPVLGRYQIAHRSGAEQKPDGKWCVKYTIIELDADAIVAKNAEQAKNMRAQRNQKLKDSDWSQVADAPVDKAVWAAYRQALRDVPAQAGFPWEINWPVAP